LLNGVDYGLLLFLVAGGLTLVFGVLGVLNFAHGSFYMLGAYLAYWLSARTGSFLVAILVGVPAMAAFGIAVEKLAIAPLYKRDHLSQVLLTYGFVLLLNDLQRALFGTEVHGVAAPEALSFRIPLGGGQTWPAYRLFVALVCVAVAATIRQAILKTRFGMRVRAGASNLEMVEALGVDVRKLFTGLFAAGTGLAGFAGMLGAPLTTVYPGMGEGVLVRSLVVVVIGGVGSLKGAFVGALLVGAADTFGRVLIPSFSSAIVYAAMAAVLVFRPQGLFGSPG
ncbi:MAG: branched-chain amino acid ABC transporter permease, partial [Myxococcales bacterium]|nr:branched-chain amino acid ABC transporter permease [Myxococcales bacterium]